MSKEKKPKPNELTVEAIIETVKLLGDPEAIKRQQKMLGIQGLILRVISPHYPNFWKKLIKS